LEEALKEAFGLGPVFDSPKSQPSGMKFAVTATTILDATLCLISNYNGKGTPSRDSSKLKPLRSTNTNILGYKHLRAKKATDEILLWEA